MRKLLILILALSVIGFSRDVYRSNASNSTIAWEAKKVTGGHNGTVNLKSGVLEYEGEQIVAGKFIVDMRSIIDLDLETEKWNKKLVSHLKSDDFFSVDSHPEVSLIITDINKKSADQYLLNADVTIKGITNPVTFEATISKKDNKIKALANISLDRTKWNIRYRSGSFFENLGDRLIYDEFYLKVELLFVKEA